MFYAETYKNLFKKYPYNNFEVIAEVIDFYFGDLFKLDVLDNEAKKVPNNGSYAQFFDWCVNQLKELHTSEEVIRKLNQVLNGDEIGQKLLTQVTFVPPVENKKSTQIAQFEKLAVGDLPVAEPLTILDMKRLVNGLNHLAKKNYRLCRKVQVVHLSHLVAFAEDDIRNLKDENQALLINLNKNLKAPAKWAVVHLGDKAKPRVYCETALFESEKKSLEDILKLKDINYEGGNTNSVLSTGHTAIAWLDTHITKAWNFDISADFSTLQESIQVAYFGGDTPGLRISFAQGEQLTFCTQAFNAVLKLSPTMELEPGLILARLSCIAGVGQFEGEEYAQSDLSAVVRIVGTRGMKLAEVEPSVYESRRMNIPRFIETMRAYPKLLIEDSNSFSKTNVHLIVPEPIDINKLRQAHQSECVKTNTNSEWFYSVFSQVKRTGSPEEFYATMMILCLIRSKSKKSIIKIDMPSRYQLNSKEIGFIVDSLSGNPFVTEFEINDNQSLKAIKQRIIPILARNRWLQENNYRPPFVANYWKEAAKYWITYLHEHQNLLEPGEQHAVFKRCALEMGIKGLEELLSLLKDDAERENIERIYGKDKPAFFAACDSKEYSTYIEHLVDHLKGNFYFPFAEFGISFQPGNNPALIKLITVMNNSERFHKMSLTDCLKNNNQCQVFLEDLTATATRERWTSFIIIPELEDKGNVSEAFQRLRAQYTLLNDLILKNRHTQTSLNLNNRIKEASHFGVGEKQKSTTKDAKAEKSQVALEVEVTQAISSLSKHETWPLKKGGVVQLQLQQQQEIQQSRQIHQEQQKIVINTVEDPLNQELVDYYNIEKLLGREFKAYLNENPLIEKAITLWKRPEGASALQGLFHTWINANPAVSAAGVIKKMTPDAAKSLMRKHPRLVSGLNPDNLPKGFHTQRSKDGELILCYSPELAYINPPNPFTMDLEVNAPVATSWKGDFRQVDLPKYMKKKDLNLDEDDWENIAFFAHFQVNKGDYTQDYEQFMKENPAGSKGLMGYFTSYPLAEHKKKIIAHWPVFLQVWQYAGMNGVEQFLKVDKQSFKISPDLVRTKLFEKQSTELKEWVKTLSKTGSVLRAFGQIYHLYGHESLTLFLIKLKQIEDALGKEFFGMFFEEVMARTSNFNGFMKISFFTSMDNMIEKLSPANAEGNRKVWQAIIQNHMDSVDWDNIEVLWRGFDYFVKELNGQDLKLEGNEFDKVPPQNMLVCMDRVIASLKQIPDQQDKIRFLSQLKTLDLTHGGIHYAIQHEGFKHFDDSLQLYDFHQGPGVTPEIYAPDLKELFHWENTNAALKMKRAIASQSQFNHEGFEVLVQRLGKEDHVSREHLIWLLHTQYTSVGGISAVLDVVESLPSSFKTQLAHHMHHAVYVLGNKQLAIQLDAMQLLAQSNLDSDVLDKYPYGTLLEAVSILHQSNQWDKKNQLMQLMNASLVKEPDCPDFIYLNSYKLAALFGALTPKEFLDLQESTKSLKPVVVNELRMLINQVLSIDYVKSDLAALQHPENWKDLIDCIQQMLREPSRTSSYRIHFIDKLNQRGLEFKYSKSGEFRALQTRAVDGPAELSFFVDHDERLWKFLSGHIVVPAHGDAKEELKPLMLFFRQLQLNRTYLNEIEPLLSSLEETPLAHYWSANYFKEFLKALQPDSDEISFPISLLKVMLKELSVSAKRIDAVQNKFPQELVAPIQSILKNRTFNRDQQAILSQIALREFEWNGRVELLNRVITTLSADAYAASRGHALEIMSKAKNFRQLETQFDNCCWILQHPHAHDYSSSWTQTCALWLKVLSTNDDVVKLFEKIKSDDTNKSKQAMMVHIVANSILSNGLSKIDANEYEVNRKHKKLVDALSLLPEAVLKEIAACYPKEPAPGTEDLLRILKKIKAGQPVKACLDQWLRTPHPEPRADYARVAATREADLQRMIFDTKVSGANEKVGLPAKDSVRLTILFATIKQLEQGGLLIPGAKQPVAQMNQYELANAFKTLSDASKADPSNDMLRAQIWAVLFEVLGRTTHKYPHLAQQFALIANDVCVNAMVPHVLQLATGEGKSHFVAMRAARNAGLGKVVDVCTAKRSLAQRDLEDYKNFFDYLNLKTAVIHPKSSRDTYVNANIHYSTTGDISLFIDEQSYAGTPIEIRCDNRVALFDEFDFIRFEEGRKTEYNYARPTGKTPKQMTWFYQAINEYYCSSKELLNRKGINNEVLESLITHLVAKAGDHEEHHNLVLAIIRDRLQLVQWLQSAHEAHELQWGGENGFTVREINIEVGEETYPMREIIPLSSDNQPMFGSTFSAGVQQLLAVRLNTEAKALPEGVGAKRKAQNFHIHPESNIMSSQVAAQRMKQLWGTWEGFSGTVSPAQAKILYAEQKTEVLHVPTNQNDLRLWHKPGFFLNEQARRDALVKQLRVCLEKKQSILFSCKNDAQVKELEKYLSQVLDASELAQLMFYTNEEERTPAEVLQDKQSKEQWKGGKKRQAIGLVASGFGRGDNVGVEAVFLFDVNDTNDKLQKGGRTARNGEEGEVFQFYLSKDLVAEEKRLMEAIELYSKGSKVTIEQMFKKENLFDDSRADELCFERVMLLREFVFTKQNEANQKYRNVISELSSWGMEHLGDVRDPQLRQELSTNFVAILKALAKSWIDISSHNDLSINQKIQKIEQEIHQRAFEFTTQYNNLVNSDISCLILEVRDDIQLGIEVPKRQIKPTKRDSTVVGICSVLMRLKDLRVDYEEVAKFPEYVDIVADNADNLYSFAKEVASCTTVKEFKQKLILSMEQSKLPSKEWTETLKATQVEMTLRDTLKEVDEPVRVRLYELMQGLRPGLQSQVVLKLQTCDLRSMTSRIKTMISILEYLKQFSFEEQERIGEEYITKFDLLVQEMPYELIVNFMRKSEPMPYSKLYTLWRLAKKVSNDNAAANEVMIGLQESIQGSPEDRLRLFSIFESWTKDLNTDEAKQFMLCFSAVMKQFKEGVDWDVFTSLVKHTQSRWNINDGSKQRQLITLWKQLSEQGDKLPVLSEFIRWNLSLGGNALSLNFQAAVERAQPEMLSRYTSEFDKVWKKFDTIGMKKRAKREKLTSMVPDLIDFYQTLDKLPGAYAERHALILQIEALNVERFDSMMRFVLDNKQVVLEQPLILKTMLGYMSKMEIPFANVNLLGQALIKTVKYHQRYKLPLDLLIYRLDAYQMSDETVLKQLLVLFKPEVTAQPLIDSAPSYLAKTASGRSAKQVEEVMSSFYQVLRDNEGNIKKMLASDTLARLFTFESDEKQQVRDDRILFMHLLHKGIFMGWHSEWPEDKNNDMLHACFNLYTEHMKRVLKKGNAPVGRDLTVAQQNQLLQLTDEFKTIGTVVQRNSQGRTHWDDMTRELAVLTESYQSSWFKSSSRSVISNQLKRQIGNIIRDSDSSYGYYFYEDVWRQLHQAKMEIMRQDMAENQSRWFKLHRNGQSRLYITINKMEDAVLSHWAQDLNAVAVIQKYHEFNQSEFQDLAEQLNKEFSLFWTENYDKTQANYHDKSRKLSRFFSSPSTEVKMTQLKNILSRFDYSNLDQRPDLNLAETTELVVALQSNLSSLPGHVAVLAREVLVRSDALMEHLRKEPTFNEVRSVLNR